MLSASTKPAAQVYPIENAPREKARAKPRLVAEFALTSDVVREAQRLRHDVFKAEYGAVFDTDDGLDQDEFDAYCYHLLVRDHSTGRIAAYTRLLSGENAERAGGFYSEHEFDLSRLKSSLNGRILEIGRTCVHPDFRSGAAITVLWSALAEFLIAENYQFLLGCASVVLTDGGEQFGRLMPELRNRHLVDEPFRVQPRRGLMVEEQNGEAQVVAMPPLLKAYMRMGAQVCGEACWDPAFNCADVFVLLDVAKLSAKYASKFMGRVAND